MWLPKWLRASSTDRDPAAGYAAFISYRQVEPDRRIAHTLHEWIETYRPPRGLAGLEGKRRPLRTFLDVAENAAGDLPLQIQSALANSDALIVVCSPRIHDKPWVNDEVERFIKARGAGRVLPLLIEGDAADSFPTALLEHSRVTLNEGSGRQREVIAKLGADIRADSVRRSLKRLRTERLKLIAPLLGVSFDTLRNRDAERRREYWKRLGVATASAALVAACLYAVSTTNWYQIRAAIRDLPRGGEIEGDYAETLLESLLRSGHEDTALALVDASKSTHLLEKLVHVGSRMRRGDDALKWILERPWLTHPDFELSRLAEELSERGDYAIALRVAEQIPADWHAPAEVLGYPPIPPPDLVAPAADAPPGFDEAPAVVEKEPPPPFPCPPATATRPQPSSSDETWERRYEALSKIGFASKGDTRRRALTAAFETKLRMPVQTDPPLDDDAIALAIALREVGFDNPARMLTSEAIQAACRDWRAWDELMRYYERIELLGSYVDGATLDEALMGAPPSFFSTASSITSVQRRLSRGDLDGAVERLRTLLAKPSEVAGVARLFGAHRRERTMHALMEVMREAVRKIQARDRREAVESLMDDLVSLQRFDSVLLAASLLDEPDARGRALLHVLRTSQKNKTLLPPPAAKSYARAAIPLLDPHRSEAYGDLGWIAEYLLELAAPGDAKVAMERIEPKDRYLQNAKDYGPVAVWLVAQGQVPEARQWLVDWYESDAAVLGALSSYDGNLDAFRDALSKVLDATVAAEGAATAMDFVTSFKAPGDELPVILDVASERLRKAHEDKRAAQLAGRAAELRAGLAGMGNSDSHSQEEVRESEEEKRTKRFAALAQSGDAAAMIAAVSDLECSQRIDVLDRFKDHGNVQFSDRIREWIAETALRGADGKSCELSADKVEKLVDTLRPLARLPVVRELLWRLAEARQDLRAGVAVSLAEAGDFHGARQACNRCDRENSAYLTTIMLVRYYQLADVVGDR